MIVPLLVLVLSGCVAPSCASGCRETSGLPVPPVTAAGLTLIDCHGHWSYGDLPRDEVAGALPDGYVPAVGPAGLAVVEMQALRCARLGLGPWIADDAEVVRTYAWVERTGDGRFGLFLFDLVLDPAPPLVAPWDEVLGLRAATIAVRQEGAAGLMVTRWQVDTKEGDLDSTFHDAAGLADVAPLDFTLWHGGAAPGLVASGSVSHAGEPGGAAAWRDTGALRLPSIEGVVPVRKSLTVSAWSESLRLEDVAREGAP